MNELPLRTVAEHVGATSSSELLALRVNVGFGLLVLGWWSGRQEFSGWVVSDFARRVVEF